MFWQFFRNTRKLCGSKAHQKRDVSVVDFDGPLASLRVSVGVAHAVAVALQNEDHEGESLSYALEYIHGVLKEAIEAIEGMFPYGRE